MNFILKRKIIISFLISLILVFPIFTGAFFVKHKNKYAEITYLGIDNIYNPHHAGKNFSTTELNFKYISYNNFYSNYVYVRIFEKNLDHFELLNDWYFLTSLNKTTRHVFYLDFLSPSKTYKVEIKLKYEANNSFSKINNFSFSTMNSDCNNGISFCIGSNFLRVSDNFTSNDISLIFNYMINNGSGVVYTTLAFQDQPNIPLTPISYYNTFSSSSTNNIIEYKNLEPNTSYIIWFLVSGSPIWEGYSYTTKNI